MYTGEARRGDGDRGRGPAGVSVAAGAAPEWTQAGGLGDAANQAQVLASCSASLV